MSKILQPNAIGVAVFPPTHYEGPDGQPVEYSQEQIYALAHALAQEIRGRVLLASDVDIRCEEHDVCAHCGALWTAEGDTGNGCCELDELEHDKELEANAVCR